MQEKHPSYLQRPPRWSCPFVKCKCHKPGFRYKVHYIEHLDQCHRRWYTRAKAHPEILAELHNPRHRRDQEGDKSVPWIDALNEQLCALESRVERVAQAMEPAIGGGDGGGGGVGSSRPPVTLRQGQSAGGSTVPLVVPPLTFDAYLESVYGPNWAHEGVPAIGAHQNYYTPDAGRQGVPSLGAADPSYHAPNLQPQDSSMLGGYHQILYDTYLAREAMGPPTVPARLQSRRSFLVAPNVTPNGSDAGDGDDLTPGQQQS